MNKKYFINFIRTISICLLLAYANCSYAFLWENLWLDLYKEIDEWILDLEEKNYEYLLWWESWEINKEINRILRAEWVWECLNNENLSIEEVTAISEWKINYLDSRISKSCKDKNWDILVDKVNQIQSNIAKINEKYSKMSEEKTKKMIEISNVWIYSDGNLENSWFDLISDIEEINNIIFSTPKRYIWENIMLQDYVLNNYFKEKRKWYSKTIKTITETPPEPEVCSKYSWNSWLNKETLDEILWSLNKKYWYIEVKKEDDSWEGKKEDDSWGDEKQDFRESPYYNIIPTWYKSINDNFSWWCKDNIFCVSIDFKVYNHKILWYWDHSIEWLLRTSNNHLKKFAWSSTSQSSMTSWFFECSVCRSFDFWKMFHMWFRVDSKPVPIMKIEKEDWKKKEKDFFEMKNLLHQYYKSNCLEYDRANDLTIYRQEEIEKSSFDNSDWLTIPEATKKINDWNKYLNLCKRNKQLTEQMVNQELLTEDMANFYDQFTEIEMHSKSILNYSESMREILLEMRKIPVHN